MYTDTQATVIWWLAWLILGMAGWPWIRIIFRKWEGQGYILAKIWGAMITAFGVLVLGMLKLIPFSWLSVLVIMASVGIGGEIIRSRLGLKTEKINWKTIIADEVLFFGLLAVWAWIKAHEPSISGLEKFMDFGFTQSILRSKYFPPPDMWFAGEGINYYYFGHLIMAMVTRLSTIDLTYTFNLMLATLFALCGSMSYAIGRQLLRNLSPVKKIMGAVLIAYLVTLGGNLQTIYAFTKGYAGEDTPPPFWTIMSNPFDRQNFSTGWDKYWYPNATRFIPYTIHEFPSYSFVVSDIHGHVLSIPIVLLMLALIVKMFIDEKEESQIWEYAVYGFGAGAAFMTNALDGPIYLGLFVMLTVFKNIKYQAFNIKSLIKVQNYKKIGIEIGTVVAMFVITILPFVLTFKPFVSGVAVNCPPTKLANTKFGPVLFEGVEKCQKSPLWMLLVLWGFFWYCAIKLLFLKAKPDDMLTRKVLLGWCLYSFLLIIFAEFFYFKDIYPMHFRSNTMFKLGYQAFMMMAIVSGYTIVKVLEKGKKNILWLVGLLPLLYLVVIYPTFSVKSYFGKLNSENYKGLYGLDWLVERHPDDYAAILWLNTNIPTGSQPVVLEANGDSYTDYDRISTFTGLPTVAGWTVHEWLWRGGYEPIAARAEEVRKIYEYGDVTETKQLLKKYKVEYVVVGAMETEKYPNLDETKIRELSQAVFNQGTTTIYKISNGYGK